MTQARVEKWWSDPENVELFFEQLEQNSDYGVREVAILMKLPPSLIHHWITTTPQLADRWRSILKERAEHLGQEALRDANRAVDKQTSAAAKVKVDAKLRLASKWYAEVYGDTLRVEKKVEVGVDPLLLGRASELLRLANERAVSEVIDADEVKALPAPAPDSEPVKR